MKITKSQLQSIIREVIEEAKNNSFKLFDVVHIKDEDTNGVILDIFGDDYRTDMSGVQYKDNLELAPKNEWEKSYERMAKTLTHFIDLYEPKYRAAFFDRAHKMFPRNPKLGIVKEESNISSSAGEIFWDNSFDKLISKFPEWLDEKRDITNSIRTAYNEHVLDVIQGEPGYVRSIPYRSAKTNDYIAEATRLWKLLKGNVWAKQNALEDYLDWIK